MLTIFSLSPGARLCRDWKDDEPHLCALSLHISPVTRLDYPTDLPVACGNGQFIKAKQHSHPWLRVLYVCFNRRLREEMEDKILSAEAQSTFRSGSSPGVHAQTINSLAWFHLSDREGRRKLDAKTSNDKGFLRDLRPADVALALGLSDGTYLVPEPGSNARNPARLSARSLGACSATAGLSLPVD